jgi:signal transduction histidine kinase
MSHELRTPLTSIIGFSEMLITDVQAEVIPNGSKTSRVCTIRTLSAGTDQ